jgi:autotransporter-like protein
MRAIAFMIALGVISMGSRGAWAEAGERSIGLEGSLLMPGFAAEDASAFSLATWGLGAFAQYGILDDLSAESHVLVGAFHGSTDHSEPFHGRTLSGQLHFASTQVHVELGARYKLYAGYNLAPYVEAMCGVLWATYSGQSFDDPMGRSYGLSIADKGEASFTVSIGLAADYRVLNMFFVGAALRYVQALSGTASHYVSAPIQVSYFW